MATDHPGWLLQLVSAFAEYEDTHPADHHGYGLACFADVLERVPADVRAQARGYAQAKRESGDG